MRNYYVGIFNDSEIINGNVIPANANTCLADLLKRSGIDVRKDFNFFEVGTNLDSQLFYVIPTDGIGEVDLDLYQFPVKFNSREGQNESFRKVHLRTNKVTNTDNGKFKRLTFNKELMEELNRFYPRQFLENMIEKYNSIADWIEEGQKIYWYRYN